MPYRNEAISREIATTYSEWFRSLYVTMRLCDAYVAATKADAAFTPTKRVITVLFTRAMNALGAATILLEEGYPLEATMLTRGVAENCINVCYIANHHDISPDELADRFMRYQDVARYDQLRSAKERGQAAPEDEYQTAVAERKQFLQDFCQIAPYKSLDDWSGLPLWSKVQRAQFDRKAPGAPRDKELELLYDRLTPDLNAVLHGGPLGWAQLILERENTITFRNGPQDFPHVYRFIMQVLPFLINHTTLVAAELCGYSDVRIQADDAQDAHLKLLNPRL